MYRSRKLQIVLWNRVKRDFGLITFWQMIQYISVSIFFFFLLFLFCCYCRRSTILDFLNFLNEAIWLFFHPISVAWLHCISLDCLNFLISVRKTEREDRRGDNAHMCLTSASVKWKDLLIMLHLINIISTTTTTATWCK